jgi:ribosome-associated toxin RatA of RatAB toxin-antitoxin module
MPIEERVRKKLERGDVDTEAFDGADGRRGARARALIAASPERIWDAITDYPHYKDFMPFTTASEIRRRDGDTVWFYTELAFPMYKIQYEIKLELKKAAWTAEWTLVSGNLKTNDGSWRLEPHGASESYVVYTVSITPGFPVLGYLFNKLTQGSLPTLIGAVRKRVGDTRYG